MSKKDKTFIAVLAGIGMVLVAGCGNQQTSSKPVPITPSPGAAPGDYTAQLRQSAQAVQAARQPQTGAPAQ